MKRMKLLGCLLLGSPLAVIGCDGGGEATCMGADCAGASGGSTSIPGGAGTVSGSGSATGGNSGSGSSPTAGSATAGGNVGAAGTSTSPGGGGSGGSGSAGSSTSGGSTTVGGTGAGGSAGSGMGGGGGSAGFNDPGNIVGQCKDDYWAAAQNGSVTRYDFVQGTNLPACAYVITHKGAGRDGDWDTVEGISTGDGGYFGAMNTEDYKQGAVCGACVEANYNGKKVVLTIVDECPVSSNPVCTKGHIDLSRKAIRQLEPNGSQENLKGVSWHYVKCPAAGNAKVRLHPNQNADWKPVVVENGLYPLKSVTLNGVNATRTGNNQGGNAWVASGTKLPYLVHAEDVNGNAISFNFNGDSGLVDTNLQFMCK